MNYAAQQILHVYRHVKKLKDDAVKLVSATELGSAYGNYHMQVSDVFELSGPENLKYKNVGYGSVVFLGNIHGKVPTQGLYYKSQELKNEIETLIRTLSDISEGQRETLEVIHRQHGQPKPQHCILHLMA
jgi:hypothetical protein